MTADQASSTADHASTAGSDPTSHEAAATGDYFEVWLAILERTSRPRFRALILDRAGVTLDPELVSLLVHVDLRGPIGVLELAELLEQNHPKISRSLARLERAGLVSRGEAASDRRVKTAEATPDGHRLVEAVNQGRRRILAEVFAGWSEYDQAELARLTLRFAEGIFALVDSLPPADPIPPSAVPGLPAAHTYSRAGPFDKMILLFPGKAESRPGKPRETPAQRAPAKS
ncbi:MAG: MarR family winged helix-turn-helix transcriptional regulator [Streptosporangiaceae bacterium]